MSSREEAWEAKRYQVGENEGATLELQKPDLTVGHYYG